MTTFTLDHTNLITRPVTLGDAEAVVDLMNAVSIHYRGHPDSSVEDVRATWQAPEFSRAEDALVVAAPDGSMVGYGVILPERPVTPFLDVYIRPDRESDELAEYLIGWCERRARQMMLRAPADARVVLRGYLHERETFYAGALMAAGFRLIRHGWHMEITLTEPPPAPVWPDGISVRSAIPGQDERAVLHVRRESFRDHFGYVDEPFEQHLEHWLHIWQNAGPFDPALWFLAMDGEQIAGINLCRPHRPDDPEMGWIATLGVMPAYRRRGLGMALLRHSFGEFYRRGIRRVGLGVDASNLTGATRLYLNAGMQVADRFDLYEKELRSGVELSVTG